MAVACPETCSVQAGKYLSFVLEDQEYGLEILKVQEIKGVAGITRVPRWPVHLRGVINLRGRVIPVIDLRRKFGLPVCADTEHTCIIIVQVPGRESEIRLGLVVDAVSDVVSFQAEHITPTTIGEPGDLPAECLGGQGRLGSRSVALLNIEGVINGDDLETVIEATG